MSQESAVASSALDMRLIPEFDGGNASVEEWLDKTELVCQLRGVSDIQTVVPLRLTGGAFSVYQQLKPEEKLQYSAVKAALLRAFAVDKFQAYEEFTARRLRVGESVDVYLADLRRLASLFGGLGDTALMTRRGTLPGTDAGKRVRRGGVCANLLSGSPRVRGALPTVQLLVNGQRRVAVIDSGCSCTIIHESCCASWRRCGVTVMAVNGSRLPSSGVTEVAVQLKSGGPAVTLSAVVVPDKPLGVDMLVGMTGIAALGGVTVRAADDVVFGASERPDVAVPGPGGVPPRCSAVTPPALTVEERDFTVTYDAKTWLKRRVNSLTRGWDDVTHDAALREQLKHVAERLASEDPARGQWCVTGHRAVLWTDASSIAAGVVLESEGGDVIEDACWLRRDEATHINMAELDAAVRGINLALAWDMKTIELKTDSATVHRWVSDALSGRARLRTKAHGEMLIRRRVDVIRQLVAELGISLTVSLVRSSQNRSDTLTRVPSLWLRQDSQPADQRPSDGQPVAAAAVVGSEVGDGGGAVTVDFRQAVTDVHVRAGHPGVRRTLYFARRDVSSSISRKVVREVVTACDVCRAVDPAPVTWRHGSLAVEGTWDRLAIDVTHYGGQSYLSVIDCGPSRFCVWRLLRRSDAATVTSELEQVFAERGAPAELLADNDTAFRSRQFAAFAARWGVLLRFRAVHRPSGNSIVERNHRSVKVIAARKKCGIGEAVHLYNITPRDGGTAAEAPANGIYRYPVRDAVRQRATAGASEEAVIGRPPARREGDFQVGDAVWVRRPGTRCTEREELACSMLERSADPADGDSHGPLLPAACFLGECQHRLSSLQRQLDAPPLNRKDQSRGPSWPVLDECVTSLLEAGARLDAADQEGDTPLLYLRSFVTQGHHELAARLAERLAAAGADVNAAAPLTRALLNAGAEVRVRRASAFCALLRGVVQRRRLEDCDTTLALLCRQMARRPAEMQRHVLGAMVSQGQHIRLLGPVFLELKSRIRRYWSQPAELRHLCCEEVRRNLQQGGGIAAGVHRLAVPPALQRCITLEDIS
ncbi:Intracisternal A-particle Pol-related polyprotein [Amphibalanus amphitrite]|uniref:RNA-directed DNA polymerase n=1 Tax=Amphibalanus amphitrite TaxID=1232801 RepID=A0A6A4W7Z3_AMPAM|nr:Intracisternal A-particle Pol-related polyprotein [Amphibalanus amphitrite]